MASYDDPQFWRDLAARLKAEAEAVPDEQAATMMREIAGDYVRIADMVGSRKKERVGG